LPTETVSSIQQMAKENLLGGAERIRGELLKLDIKVVTATIQKYMRLARPHRAPKANAICERFLGSVRRECLDHILVLGESHLYRVVKGYVAFFNQACPHQGIKQRIPEGTSSEEKEVRKGKIIAFPVLNRLHHDYRRVA